MRTAYLPHRGVIRVTGADRGAFLQAMLTQDMRRVSAGEGVYACFLTPQGKYLADFFVVPESETVWLIDIDKVLLDDLVRRLGLFRMRSKVTFEDTGNEYRVHAVRDEYFGPELSFRDPRFNRAGWRVLAKNDLDAGENFDYETWRLENGLPDTADFGRERSTMAECNMDKLNAVAWDKGCYVGQELTARVQYRGLAKKRLLPLRLYEANEVPYDAPVMYGDKIVGTSRSGTDAMVLALMQLEAVEPSRELSVNGIKAEPVIPEWFGG